MNNMFTLKQIAEKLNGEMVVEIPALQRGLVWTPKQVEFLWDSILRGFPIGGFVLSENNKKTYDLMDGQQRFNSIQIGFLEPKKDSTVILWLDINPTVTKGSTRKYYVKATTISHPWGYKNNDECDVLSAGERRKSLDLYFGTEDKNIYKDNINIIDTFPYESRNVESHNGFPIPLSFFINNEAKNENDFFDCLLKKIDTLSDKWKDYFWNEKNQKFLREHSKEWYKLFSEIRNNYTVPFSILPRESLDNENKTAEEQSDLEILFNRLNTGGTRITQADLSYSAIKAYWGEIKEKSEKLARGFMPVPKLVLLLFRLYLTINNSSAEKFESQISIKKIRSLALNADEKIDIINFFIKIDKAEKIIDETKNAIKEIPSFIQMRVLTIKQECFLLLFYLASKGYDLIKLNCKGLLLLLFWFCKDNETTFVINQIFKNIKDSRGENDVLKKIKETICSLIENERILCIYNPIEIKEAVLEDGKLKENYKEEPEFFFLHKIFTKKTLLLYAQRLYLQKTFPNYNPSDTISWESHNRPWDYDHIIPKEWSSRHKLSERKERVDYWRDTIGNFAAIPFEINRSKSNLDNFKYYVENDKDLYFDDGYNKIKSNITLDEQMVTKFENLSFKRTMRIYEECYKAFEDLLLYIEPERTFLLKSIVSQIGDKAKIYFADVPKEFEVKKAIDYLHTWLSVEIEISKYCMLSFSWYKNYDNEKYEFGLRKHITLNKTNKDIYNYNKELFDKLSNDYGLRRKENNDWWYLYTDKIEPKDAASKLVEIYNEIEGKVR